MTDIIKRLKEAENVATTATALLVAVDAAAKRGDYYHERQDLRKALALFTALEAKAHD